MIQQTTALRKISRLNKKIRVVRGGQGAAKTISILILCINHASGVADREIFVISAELTKMRLTVIKDFVKLMKQIGIYEDSRFIAGTLYRFPNGSFIKFIGLDQEDIGKGLRCHVAYFNEVNKVNLESYRQIASRAGLVFADYNPDAEFFMDTDVIPREDCDFLQLTFEDNELLDPREREEILRYKSNGYNTDGTIKDPYWANLWQVYGLGNTGSLQGVVFSNWEEIPDLPRDKDGNLECERVAYGLDFGFTNDPAGLIDVYRWNKDLIWDELVYERELTNPALSERMTALKVDRYSRIVADCAEPKSIQELEDLGWGNIEKSKKGDDSVRAGIQLLHQYKIWVTSRSKNCIKELRSYRWAEDKNGKPTNKPEDKNNHLIDPARYVALNCLLDSPMELY